METVWMRRSDGAEFCVEVGSDAYANLVAKGALRLDREDAPQSETDDDGADDQAPTP